MNGEMSTVERLALEIGAVLEPLRGVLASEDAMREFVRRELGFDAPEALGALGIDLATIDAVIAALDDLGDALAEEEPDPAVIAMHSGALAIAVAGATADISAAGERAAQGLDPAFLTVTNFVEEFPRRLLDWLVIEQLEEISAVAVEALRVLAIIEVEPVEPDPATFTTEHTRRAIHLDRLASLFTDPNGWLEEAYGWDTDASSLERLVERLFLLALAARIPAALRGADVKRAEILAGPAAIDPEEAGTPPELRIPLLSGETTGSQVEVGVALVVLPAHDQDAEGLALLPFAGGQLAAEVPLDQLARWVLGLSGSLDLQAGFGVVARPRQAVHIVTDLDGAGAQAFGRLEALVRRQTTAEPIGLITFSGDSGVFVTGVIVRAAIDIEASESPELAVEAGVEEALVRVRMGESDGFLRSVLPDLEVQFDAGFGFSTRRGAYFVGAAGLKILRPVNKSLGPAEIRQLTFELQPSPAGAPPGTRALVGLGAAVHLGPVTAAVDGLGAQLTLRQVPGGNLGPVDLQVGFKPPSGAALSIDAGAVTGGGFLFFDPEREQYAGGMHLEFEGGLTLNAIGLLTTRMPDGTRGFSLLVIVQASGFTPVQLGVGFTLNGVGGLLGINRTVATEVLRAGVRSRSLDAILFSQDDPTPRAPQIVSTLQSVFPPARDRFTFGPMALIGWGTPTVLTIEVALVLELPSPVRLMILGRLKAALPKPDAALVKINMDAFGLIDFERREASVDATLYDSTVGSFALTGDMALRAGWGDQPAFLLSIGGFHPAFSPPPGLPVLRRLAIALSTGNNPRLRAEAYLAITSNTVQIGAGLEFYVEALGFNLSGGFGFDALLQLSPFLFQVDIRAHLALRRGRTMLAGIEVTVHLDGPTPWHARGVAKLKILFFSVSVQFEATFGDPAEIQPRESVRIWEERLKPELENVRNWSAQLPDDAGRLAAFRDSGEVLVHPLGSASVSQRIVPLGHEITRFGAAEPDGPRRFQITGCEGLALGDPTFDFFAPAQFFEMSDDEKLSSPSFDRMPSGANFAADTGTVVCGDAKVTPLAYETIVVEDEDEQEISE